MSDSKKREYLPWTEYVYIWVCATPSGVCAKVGVTNNPRRRFSQFRTSCPFSAFETYLCQAPSREASLRLEVTVLRKFSAFAAHGEWIKVPFGKVGEFVTACTLLARDAIDAKVFFREEPMFYRRKRKFSGARPLPRRLGNGGKARTGPEFNCAVSGHDFEPWRGRDGGGGVFADEAP